MNHSSPERAGIEPEIWPSLPFEEWRDTYATLHMWTQVIGKIRLALTPLENHWWNVPLYLTPRGLSTSSMPYGPRTFEINFDFIEHRLLFTCSDGTTRALDLVPRSVAEFYREVWAVLRDLDIEVKIWPVPVEVENPVPFEEDHLHASYDAEYANRFWRILVQCDRVFKEFRSRFIGKSSPVHFFWGSFDLAVTRFSGRRAPEREGADSITREAYSHEVISHGFWPGGATQAPAFYSYTAPEPEELSRAQVRPSHSFYSTELKEFLLPYEDVRRSQSPDATLLEFMQSTYEAGADLAGWSRADLERAHGAQD